MTVVLNLCPTPSFAGGVGGWTCVLVEGATGSIEPSSAWHGSRTVKSLKFAGKIGAGSNSQAILQIGSTTPTASYAIPVTAGEPYSFGAAFSGIPFAGALPVKLVVEWHSAAGGLLSNTIASFSADSLVLANQIAPAGSACCRLNFVIKGGEHEGTFDIDEIQVNEGPTLNPYTDGSMPGAEWTQLAWRSQTVEASQAPVLPTLGTLVLFGRQCETDAQRELIRVVEPVQGIVLPGTTETGWYDQSKNSETGWFALCAEESALEPYVGSVLRLRRGETTIYTVLLGVANLTTPLALARRAYVALAPLNVSSIPCAVEVR